MGKFTDTRYEIARYHNQDPFTLSERARGNESDVTFSLMFDISVNTTIVDSNTNFSDVTFPFTSDQC